MPTRSKTLAYTTVPDGYIEPKIGKRGYAALEPITVIDQFKKIVETCGPKPAMALKRPKDGKVRRPLNLYYI